MNERDPLTGRIIRCAIELHRGVGCGLLERVYRRGLAIEFRHHGINYEAERRIEIKWRGIALGVFIPDFIIEDEVVLEVKSASAHDRVFDAQILTYMRLTGRTKGLLLNFGRPTLTEGVKRFVL